MEVSPLTLKVPDRGRAPRRPAPLLPTVRIITGGPGALLSTNTASTLTAPQRFVSRRVSVASVATNAFVARAPIAESFKFAAEVVI